MFSIQYAPGSKKEICQILAGLGTVRLTNEKRQDLHCDKEQLHFSEGNVAMLSHDIRELSTPAVP